MMLGNSQIWMDHFISVDERLIERIAFVWPLCTDVLPSQPVEDTITINLVNHLCNDPFVRRICHWVEYQFEPFGIDQSGTKYSKGKIDIAVLLDWNRERYVAYECKRLNVTHGGKRSSLAKDYVSEGMMRFMKNQYADGLPVGCMLGYVIDGDLSFAMIKLTAAINSHKPLCLIEGPTAAAPVQYIERSPTMKKPSIYPDRSQELLALFEQAGNNKKIMCVPIDYAKKDHLVMFCNGYGEVLRKPFSVNNTVDGVKYLLEQVSRSCRHRHIRPEHVFFSGEDINSYAENFANTLRAKGWLVANVNAHDAKKQRENIQASTDRTDLMGIAAMLLNRRANCCPAQSGVYRDLRTLVRHRKKLVKMKTEVRNRIHTIVDRLFPGFLNEKKSGTVPFSSSSLYLMQERFSAPQIRRRQRPALIRHPGSCPSKKPMEIGTEECCLKIGTKKGLQKSWCSKQTPKTNLIMLPCI